MAAEGPQLTKDITFLTQHDREELLFSKKAAANLGDGTFSDCGGQVRYTHPGEWPSFVQRLLRLYMLSRRCVVARFEYENNTDEAIPLFFDTERKAIEKTQIKNGTWADPDYLLKLYDYSPSTKYVLMPVLCIIGAIGAVLAGGLAGGITDHMFRYERGVSTSTRHSLAWTSAITAGIAGGTLSMLPLYYSLRVGRWCRELRKKLQGKITAEDGTVRFVDAERLILLKPGEKFERYGVWLPPGY